MATAERTSTDSSRRHSAQSSPPKSSKPQWLVWALGSGAFAATNGVFAKLTTADTTVQIAHRLFSDSKFAELVLRAVFFGLNLVSNAIMWILFTRALTAASSTTRVSVLNTSANFLVTAVYGLIVFGESFSWEWVLGATLLMGGCVVIGRREGGEVESKKGELGEVSTRDELAGDGAIRLSGEERRTRDESEERDYVDGPGKSDDGNGKDDRTNQ